MSKYYKGGLQGPNGDFLVDLGRHGDFQIKRCTNFAKGAMQGPSKTSWEICCNNVLQIYEVFPQKMFSRIHCNFLFTLACSSTYSVNVLLKNIHFSHSMYVIAQDVSSLLSKVFHIFHMLYHLMFVEFLSWKNVLLHQLQLCVLLHFLTISCGIKLHRSQQRFRPRNSTCFGQCQVLVIHFIFTPLAGIIFWSLSERNDSK